MAKRILTHGSTFSGIGAPEIAAEMLGWHNAFHCEINPFGRKILDFYFPDSESYGDITKTDFTKWAGKIDILTGGFPCQPFSYAGKRRGSEDDRYLWPFMLKCIESIRPTWFIGENVAGLTTMVFPGEAAKVGCIPNLFDEENIMERNERYVLDSICGELENIGYTVQPLLIPAAAVGAPHRRDRIFIIAHRNAADTDRNGQSTPKQQGGCQWQEMDGKCKIQPLAGTAGPCGQRPAPDPYGKRRQEIYQQVQSKLDDGAEPVSNGRERNVTDTHSPGGDTLQQGGGAESSRCNGFPQQGKWGDTAKWADGLPPFHRCYPQPYLEQLRPENRWKAFPSVSPVYRGNDGISFDVDRLTIPFGRWKRESLQAYGNAIVVQVMYEIFRAIDEIENQ